MTVHHHKYKFRAELHARRLRKLGNQVTLVQYSDKTYGVYSYKDGKR